ncbi:four helix bundle protein [Rapidithrix thailandica]|uniref:Four helix bundle protein n=1 Tax=Rapidithrix thailandica TaxID=413964 RepID=A0AAW9SFI0_9BACT
MDKIKSFKDLNVWKLAHQTVLKLYKLTEDFPTQEKFGITSQLTRAAVSIPANIAEGSGRNSAKEYIHYLTISRGSVEECKYLILLSKDLEFIKPDEYEELEASLNEIGKMLNGLINSIRKSTNT